MFTRFTSLGPATIMLLSSAGSVSAAPNGLFPPDSCAIVVASEVSIPRLMSSPAIARLPIQDYWIFETSNGAVAAVIGAAPLYGREAIIGELLENGVVESDAFCSHPDKLLHLAAEPPASPLPLYGDWDTHAVDAPSFEESSPGSEDGTHLVPQWAKVPTLGENATIDDWLRASHDVKLSSAVYYTNFMIQSDAVFTVMMQNGSMLEHMKKTVACTDAMVMTYLGTNQKTPNDMISPITVVCAGIAG